MGYATREQLNEWIEDEPAGTKVSYSPSLMDWSLAAARRETIRVCRRRFEPPADTDTTYRHFLSPHQGLARPRIWVRDVATITSVVEGGSRYSTGRNTVPAAQYVALRDEDDHPADRLLRLDGNGEPWSWMGTYVDVTGRHGWLSIPLDIVLANCMIAYKLLKARQRSYGESVDNMLPIPVSRRDTKIWDMLTGYRRRSFGQPVPALMP